MDMSIYTRSVQSLKIKIFTDRGDAEYRLQNSNKVPDKQKVVEENCLSYITHIGIL